MMQLLSAWKESLQLFKPSNFKLFFLVTLKTFVGTLQVWLKYWWWLIGLVLLAPDITTSFLGYFFPINGRWIAGYKAIFFMMGGADIIAPGLPISSDGISLAISPKVLYLHLIRDVVMLIFTCLLSFLYTSLYLCVRPSVAIKNWSYFKNYSRQFFYITLWFLIILPFLSAAYTYINVNLIGSNSLIINVSLLALYFVVVSSITLFYIIFILDSDRSSRVFLSIIRAFRMVIYNLPFLILAMAAFFTVYACILFLNPFYIISRIFGFEFKQIIVDMFFTLLLACFFVNYYIKKIHDNYSLYVGN